MSSETDFAHFYLYLWQHPFFDNNQCLKCGSTLGFMPNELMLKPIQPLSDGRWHALDNPDKHYRMCEHYKTSNVCNWMVPIEDDESFCRACRLNSVIPDLTKPDNVTLWYKLERDKRRLIYTLILLGLPIIGYKQDIHHGLSFRFMEDVVLFDPYSQEMTTYETIMTGHDTGTITINIVEADDSQREANRKVMNESYRTTLGHFRHEIGHYYWEMLINKAGRLDSFRVLFGDERNDYQQSLANYYQYGSQYNWSEYFISAYASSHPWEDWAETWAHYLHIVDLLETAGHHHVRVRGVDFVSDTVNLRSWLHENNFNSIISELNQLTVVVNELNRSLGFPEPYPFEHSTKVIEKLNYVHNIVMSV